jgi:iron complex transport system ATP-binding protein
MADPQPLQARDLRVGDRSRPRLALSWSLLPGQVHWVVGVNGSGKTTLLRVLAGLLPPDAGRVCWGDRDLSGLSARERAGVVAWLPQSPPLELGLRAVDVVAAARFRFGEPRPVALRAARAALEVAGLGALSDRPMEALSGGEAQQVRLASCAAQGAETWLLDEPTNHLDPRVRWRLIARCTEAAASGVAVVLATHDLALLPLAAGPVLALAEGQVAWRGRSDAEELPTALSPLFGVELAWWSGPVGRRLVTVGERS